MVELVGKLLGRYRILEEVGRGGMATVYRAYDSKDNREVAVKVLSPYVAQEPKFKARFEQEIQVLCHLQHTNIVPILDYSETGEYAYIVMPFMTAGTLQQRMIGSPLPLTAAADILHQISQALDYAHAHGVVHRDIKPSNVLITEEGKVMLSDFGFARVIDTSLSLTGSAIIGTPAYMSPEQCRGEEATSISDQYSLGVILYQMATGRLPYEAETPMGVVIMHATEPLPPPRLYRPDLPGRVEAVILKALEKCQKDRYPSILAFNEAFQVAVLGRKRNRAANAASITPVFDRPTMIFRGISYRVAKLRSSLRLRRRSSIYSILLLLIATAAILWGFLGWQANGGSAGGGDGSPMPFVDMSSDRSAELMQTIEALSTANAPQPGTVLAPGRIETAVAGTLAVLLSTPDNQADNGMALLTIISGDNLTSSPAARISVSPTSFSEGNTPNPTFVPQATPGFSTAPGSSNTPGPGITPSPSETPSATASLTITPSPTPSKIPTMTATFTSTPSRTPILTATFTPNATQVPTIDPDKCKSPGHPVFGCTPTPTP